MDVCFNRSSWECLHHQDCGFVTSEHDGLQKLVFANNPANIDSAQDHGLLPMTHVSELQDTLSQTESRIWFDRFEQCLSRKDGMFLLGFVTSNQIIHFDYKGFLQVTILWSNNIISPLILALVVTIKRMQERKEKTYPSLARDWIHKYHHLLHTKQ